MITALIMIGITVGFFLVWPWVVCLFQKHNSPLDRYLDWVYNIVNQKKGD